MSTGNYEPAFCEDLHGKILNEFHLWRKEHNLKPDVLLDGIVLTQIIGRAKIKLYDQRPEAKNAGYRSQNDETTDMFSV